MLSHAVLPRILGALFYYSPGRPEVSALFDCLTELPDLYSWQDKHKIARLSEHWPHPDDAALAWQFSVLFEGQGMMPVPPWGSVYLERDNLLMGESTASYRTFLQTQGLTFTGEQNEPEDQFGLMLLAYSALIEQENEVAARTLLESWLLPWATHYLGLLQRNEISPFYAQLAEVAALFLTDLQQQLGLRPEQKRLFFG
ncbi:molecular chaperone [Klebsiella sp. BIGb0407]|uniref:TorD/DmsD family molecular chaperone n=1 Tax=Klebsiella sp. BIGb0407 TaxID=2940603 RepID=UPI00216A2887|nr:molecular chaperone [Klebsiella sp. BIGb0407]MCS3431733.1 TorA maturation chaperone TorD [Klebsiella sp. BIGb0407]